MRIMPQRSPLSNPAPTVHPRPAGLTGTGRRSNIGQRRGRSRGAWGLRPLRVLLLLVWLLLLGGCVDLDTEVRFPDANHGALVQRVRLSEGWQVWGEATAKAWLDRWAAQARTIGGQVLEQSDRTLTIAIPFQNGQDLQSTFQTFSQALGIVDREAAKSGDRSDHQTTAAQTRSIARGGDRLADRTPKVNGNSLPDPALLDPLAFPSQFQLQQQNWLVAVRNQLRYEVDLRSLAALGGEQLALVDTSRLLRWQFGLRVPHWGQSTVQRPHPEPDLNPQAGQPNPTQPNRPSPQRQQGRWVWTLEPGTVTTIEAVFWVPSWVGIGGLMIGLLGAIGWWRWRPIPISSPPETEPAETPNPTDSTPAH